MNCLCKDIILYPSYIEYIEIASHFGLGFPENLMNLSVNNFIKIDKSVLHHKNSYKSLYFVRIKNNY